ncbi:hypothetical protein TNCV_2675701 [Trichonephila clavipes]|nr:hypothetical protein TNCV_2675701 [Trichonephila clavipes]
MRIPANNRRGCAAFHSRRESITGGSPIPFPEEDTTMPYSGFKPEPTRLQVEDHIHHTGWAGAVAASKAYIDSLGKLARHAHQGTWGGCTDIVAAESVIHARRCISTFFDYGPPPFYLSWKVYWTSFLVSTLPEPQSLGFLLLRPPEIACVEDAGGCNE